MLVLYEVLQGYINIHSYHIINLANCDVIMFDMMFYCYLYCRHMHVILYHFFFVDSWCAIMILLDFIMLS